MRKSFWFLALLTMFASVLPARAQDGAPRVELYGGYYIQVNDRGSSYNFNGGSGQLAYNFNHWLGIAGDLGGYYTGDGFHAGIFSYLFGPRINFRGMAR
jgi:hypothetical protein